MIEYNTVIQLPTGISIQKYGVNQSNAVKRVKGQEQILVETHASSLNIIENYGKKNETTDHAIETLKL